MSDSKNTVTTGGVTYGVNDTNTTAPAQAQVKVSYEQAIKQLEKQHKLGKLQAELAEFRVREVMANMHYLQVLQKANAADGVTPSITGKVEETKVEEPKTETNEPS